MKPIIIATDFSEAANNAADYAVQLARELHAELILVHVWSLPVLGGETLNFPNAVEELQQGQLKRVKDEAERLNRKWNWPVRAVERMGFVSDELNECCAKEHASFVVMGMAKGKHLLGSTASAFCMHAAIPVFIIPHDASWRAIRKILLATDLNSGHHWHELGSLKELAEKMFARFHILHVNENLEDVASVHRKDGEHLEKFLHATSDQWHFAEGDVVLEAEDQAAKMNADLVVFVHHHLPWYRNIFHLSSSKEMVRETHRPLLILPD